MPIVRALRACTVLAALSLATLVLAGCGPMPGPPPVASASAPPASSLPARSCRDALLPLVARMMARPDDPAARDFPKPPECAATSDVDYQRQIIDLSLDTAGNTDSN